MINALHIISVISILLLNLGCIGLVYWTTSRIMQNQHRLFMNQKQIFDILQEVFMEPVTDEQELDSFLDELSNAIDKGVNDDEGNNGGSLH